MTYTASELERDVKRLLDAMVRRLESQADCDSCNRSDVSISGKEAVGREYARKIARQVSEKLGLR